MAAESLSDDLSDAAEDERRIAGGAATAGGMNYQAAVTAIAGVRLMVGMRLGWLDEVADDVPASIWAETRGPGDDIRIDLIDGTRLEAQVKKGLQASDDLWAALISLAKGIRDGVIQYGVLIVAPDSSGTVKTELPRVIQDIANATTDALEEWRSKLLQKLSDAGVDDTKSVCSRLFVKVISAIDTSDESINTAHVLLRQACVSASVPNAWDALYLNAHTIIARKGRWDASTIMRLFRSRHIEWLPSAQIPIALVDRISSWTVDVNRHFSVLGSRRPLSIQSAWLPLKVALSQEQTYNDEDAASVLARYRTYEGHDSADKFDAEWIGRFHFRAVVIAGPGMGKSVLLAKAASRYAEDGYPVLKVRLATVAKRMAGGEGFEESALSLGVDGFGVGVDAIRRAGIRHWVLLCDGLDECGALHEQVAEGIVKFATGYPQARVIVTTRPVGYSTSKLKDWRHYDLIPPSIDDGAKHLGNLLHAILPKNDNRIGSVPELAAKELRNSVERKVISRSPLLLGMAASLLANGRELAASKMALYKGLIELIDGAKNERATAPPESLIVRSRMLDLLGWCNISFPTASPTDIVRKCGDRLADELGCAPLKAREKAEHCLQHWEDVGVVERLNHGGAEFLAFVHRTFAEFSAARDLVSLPAEEKRERIKSFIDDSAWFEVLEFASRLGLSELLIDILIDKGTPNALEHALDVACADNTLAKTGALRRLIEAAGTALDKNQGIELYTLATTLADLAHVYPIEVGVLASEHLQSSTAVLRHFALACVLEARVEGYEKAEDLLEVLREISNVAPGWIARPKAKLKHVMDIQAFHRRLALQIGRHLLLMHPHEEVVSLVEQAVLGHTHTNKGVTEELERLLGIKGSHSSIPDPNLFGSIGAFLTRASPSVPDEYGRGFHNLWRALLSAADRESERDNVDYNLDRPLVQVAALIKVVGLDNAPVTDFPIWATPCDQETVRTVVQAAIATSAIDRDLLLAELPAALAQCERNWGDGKYVVDLMPDISVDIPNPDWAIAAGRDVDEVVLREVLKFGSVWLVKTAINLHLAHYRPNKKSAKGYLSVSAGYALQMAVALAEELDSDEADSLLVQRAGGQEVLGLECVFRALSERKIRWSASLGRCINKGLMAKASNVAAEAANLAASQAERGALLDISLLERALEHWTAIEAERRASYMDPWQSPLHSLIRALDARGAVSDDRLIDLLAAKRRDVRDLADQRLQDRWNKEPDRRSSFIDRAKAGSVPHWHLEQLISRQIHFEPADVEALSTFLDSADPNWRMAAMMLLNELYMEKEKIFNYAERMQADPEDWVADRARQLLAQESTYPPT